MARQYKIEVTYTGIPLIAEVYWHDNDTIEFVTIPSINTSESLVTRTELLSVLMNFMKKDRVTKVECNKLP
jgi:hypothetical protein